MKNLAIIPARSGSKGLKDKNIKSFFNKPLMAYSIEAAINSSIFHTIHLSTDSVQYAEIGKYYGADIPFLRKQSLCTDVSSTWEVARYVLNKYKELGCSFDMITILQPTSPLRNEEDIQNAYSLFCNRMAYAVVSMTETDYSPLWCNKLPEDKSLENFIPKSLISKPRQILPSYYRINGAIYMIKCDYLQKEKNIYSKNCYAYIMPKERSIDIDDEWDFTIAKLYMDELTKKL